MFSRGRHVVVISSGKVHQQRISGYYIKRQHSVTCASEVHKAVTLIMSTEGSENYRNGMGISGRIMVSSSTKIRQFFEVYKRRVGYFGMMILLRALAFVLMQ
jgi:hypothetical protein